MSLDSLLGPSIPGQPGHYSINEQKWGQLREQLVQYVKTSDGEHEYEFRCETPTELWRARTLLTKEEGTVAWIKDEVTAGDVFYDIGANIGLYTLMAGRRVGLRGLVYAFEPHVANVVSLLHNVNRNGIAEQVKVLSCALNDREGYFDFNYQQPSAGSSMSQLGETHDAGGQSFAPVFSELKHATTIDILLARGLIRPATLVKMDVDGNEMLILRGMREFLASPFAPRSVQVEINIRYKDELFAFMRERGYTDVVRHDTDHGKKAIRQGHDPESIGYNLIFRKPSVR